MTKRKTIPATTITPSALPSRLTLAGREIVPLQYFHVADRHPRGAGPWSAEADKIGWVDEASGMPCIILRQTNGTWSGYVGISPDHPLYGYDAGAVPAGIGISVHGGLTYARMCEASVPERVSVCHVPAPSRAAIRDSFEGADVWWLGFDTNHEGDFVPNGPRGRVADGAEVYRDQTFTYIETSRLAAQLASLEMSEGPRDTSTIQIALFDDTQREGDGR